MQKIVVLTMTFVSLCPLARGQSLGSAGTVEGTVVDPSGSAVVDAGVEITNPITGYQRKTVTDTSGTFRFTNVPPNPYHLRVNAPGFAEFQQDALSNCKRQIQNSSQSAMPSRGASSLWIAGGDCRPADHFLPAVGGQVVLLVPPP